MSRKNLSRTVIEGGRDYYNRYVRRASHGEARATTRAWLDRIAADLDEADATVAPARQAVPKMFHDKLAPAHRWLVAQVGRLWSKVYSELCSRFDTRTVAGRHVVHDHMLAWVRRHDDPLRRHSRYELVIDVHGILRKPLWFGLSWPAVRRALDAWTAGRVCALTHRGWWWFHREPAGEPCLGGWACARSRKSHSTIGGVRYHAIRLVADRPMSRKQVRYLEQLPAEFRHSVIVSSPWRAR